jgi:hypothetical protein
VPRRSLAALLVALCALAGCSSGSDEPRAKPGVTGVRAGDLTLDVFAAEVVSPQRERAELAPALRRQALRVLQRTFDATVVDPLTTGRGGDLSKLFTADAAARASGPDRGAVFDEGFAPLEQLVGSRTSVALTGLAGDDGAPAMLVARIDWDVRDAADAVQVHRVGELTLVPAFGTWVVGAYTMLVNRTAGGETTTTTAATP